MTPSGKPISGLPSSSNPYGRGKNRARRASAIGNPAPFSTRAATTPLCGARLSFGDH